MYSSIIISLQQERERGHMTRKSHNMMSQDLEQSRRIEKSLEDDVRVYIYSMLALRQIDNRHEDEALLLHSVHMVHSQITHGLQGRMHSRCIVIAQTMKTSYKQLVEYCCSSLSSSLVNYTTHVPHQISALEIYLLVLLLDTGLVVATTHCC